MPVSNPEIAAMLDRTAELLEIKGDNPFRVRAYRRAARVVEGLPRSAARMTEAGETLFELPGIGKDLAGKIATIAKTGTFDLLESLKRELPGDLAEIAAIPGLGPKRVKLFFDRLGVRSIADLRRAAETGALRRLRGVGPKLEQNIMAALAKPAGPKRFKLPFVEAEAHLLVDYLAQGLTGASIALAGSYRRRRDTLGDLDILVAAKRGAAAGDRLASYENNAEVLVHGPSRTSVVLRSGLHVDLRAAPEESFGAALMYFTGSKAHNIALRNLANERGWKLNEYGLFAGRRRIAGVSEEGIFEKLGLAFVPPELREDRGEVELAKRGQLPKLVTLADIRGDLHVHSSWSDGAASIEEMARAAKARGYAYMALTDHSQRLTVAKGLTPARLSRQLDEIERLGAELDGFTLLTGAEVDILADGRLDLPDAVLARLDVVVAAVHSHFDLPRDKQTERIIRAMDNRRVSILAHPTGRLIGEREPMDIDVEKILRAASERGCCLELNAQPDRLDLSDIHAKAAKTMGVKMAISTDAHSTAGLANMRYGVDQARRGWLEPSDVVNARPLREFKKALKR